MRPLASPVPDTPVLTPPAPSGPAPLRIPFSNTYARLPQTFHARTLPVPVAAPRLIKLNVELARFLGLDPEALASPEGAEILAGNRVAEGSEPLAIAYAGHQFGHFVPQLGDGRANLLGEVVATNGVRYDIQLKGSGPTPFSRRGDGRAALGPVLREYILSEAMYALGVPTTRALAAVLTGETVMRETVLPGAVFTRVAHSHLRVGTFAYFAARGDMEGLRTLADYAIQRHYPELAQSPKPYGALLEGVIGRQARLIAHWMSLGFIHGVMNTDNMSISGETIDYGPCAFLEAYDPGTVFSSIDHAGRYAFGNQPNAAHWNLARLAEALLPLLAVEAGSPNSEAALPVARAALDAFEPQFQTAYLARLRAKLGLLSESQDEADPTLIDDLLNRLAANEVDFTAFFRRLCDAAASPAHDANLRILFKDPTAFDSWATAWRGRLAQEPVTAAERAAAMREVNPAVIPRNHLVEEVIQAAVAQSNFGPFEELVAATAHPYQDPQDGGRYTTPALPEQQVTATFCGT